MSDAHNEAQSMTASSSEDFRDGESIQSLSAEDNGAVTTPTMPESLPWVAEEEAPPTDSPALSSFTDDEVKSNNYTGDKDYVGVDEDTDVATPAVEPPVIAGSESDEAQDSTAPSPDGTASIPTTTEPETKPTSNQKSQEDAAVATAMAAIAAAVNASSSSPSQAAEAARSLLPAAKIVAMPNPPNQHIANPTIAQLPPPKKPVKKPVRLAKVRSILRHRLANSEPSFVSLQEEEREKDKDDADATVEDSEGGDVTFTGKQTEEKEKAYTGEPAQEGGAKKTPQGVMAAKLASGEYDCFLEHLLLLSSINVTAEEDDQERIDLNESGNDGEAQIEAGTLPKRFTDENSADSNAEVSSDDALSPDSKPIHNDLDTTDISNADDQQEIPSSAEIATDAFCEKAKPHEVEAAEAVINMLSQAEAAYDALLQLLPPHLSPSSDVQPVENRMENDEMDSENLIPDLLPPCTTPSGDATAEFFRACAGPTETKGKKSLTSAELTPPSGSEAAIGHKQKKGKNDIKSGLKLKESLPNGSSSLGGSTSSSGHTSSATSMFSNVLSTVNDKMKSAKDHQHSGGTLAGVFGKRRRGHHSNSALDKSKKEGKESGSGNTSSSVSSTAQTPSTSSRVGRDGDASSDDETSSSSEYTVQINREMLGLTVENVLERTVVRTVLPGGAAKKAGAKVGSLIVKVGSVETKNLTHFETIDELRQSQRPLKLVLKRISRDALRGAREEMGRLIRGGGFGLSAEMSGSDPNEDGQRPVDEESNIKKIDVKKKDESPLGEKGEAFFKALRVRWEESKIPSSTKKDESLLKVGEKLAWILTLLIIGLEREAARLAELASDPHQKFSSSDISGGNEDKKIVQHHNHHHTAKDFTAKDYRDAAKSVSKILLDYVTKQLGISGQNGSAVDGTTNTFTGNMSNHHNSSIKRKNRKGQPQHIPLNAMARQKALGKKHVAGLPGTPGTGKRGGQFAGSGGSFSPDHSPESPLHAIGDVLHRTRSFLADPSSPPAALLRGEVISFLCDVLDIDIDMDLSEEETASSVAGSKASPINDLGSAGSLLKLIVLNCSMMRSPGCVFADNEDDPPLTRDENTDRETRQVECRHKTHAGNRFLAVVHRLAASRSTSARVTACSLGPVLWGHLDFPHQLQLRGVITRALHDVEVIVRKSTATVLHEIAELVFDPRAVPWLVLMCERAMTDPEPQLRAAAMTLTWHLAEHLPNTFLGDASKGSRSLRRLPPRTDPTFAEVYLLQCKLLPVATRLAEDRAAAVRLAVAAQCDRLCNALGEHWFSVIIDLLQALLGDNDERVRSEATLCLPRLVESVLTGSTSNSSGINVLDSLLPLAIKLLKDPCVGVRISLATASGELLTLLVGLASLEEIHSLPPTNEKKSLGGKASSPGMGSTTHRRDKKHVDETLIPLVQRLLHDTDPEVTSAALRAVTNASRGNVREISSRRPQYTDKSEDNAEDDTISLSSHQSLQSMRSVEKAEPVFIPVLSEQQVLRLLPTLSDLATSPQWRVRQSAVEIVPALLGCTHRLETRSEIAQLCVQLMGDTVDAVRRTAAECLCLGGGRLGAHGEDDGGEWIIAIVIPHLRRCKDSADSKQRMLSLKMVEVILVNGVCPMGSKHSKSVATSDTDGEKVYMSPLRAIVETAASLSDDRVVNVRLNVGRIFGSVVHYLEEEELRFVLKVIEKQLAIEKMKVHGGDRDVIYFAKRAIALSKSRLDEVSLPSNDDSLRRLQ